MTEAITRNELTNDGQSIHLYFNGLVGLYAAYGYSAYLLSKVITVAPAYSWDMQMPVVVINPATLKEVENSLARQKHTTAYYCFKTEQMVNQDEYTEWAEQLREQEERKH